MDAFDAYRARPGEDTLVALLRSQQDTVYNLCYQVLRHPQNAQDSAQQVLIQLLDVLPKISDGTHLRQWLHRAAFHVSLDLKKVQKRRREREERVATMDESRMPDEVADEVQLHVSKLDDELRTLVVEHYFEQRPLAELAAERHVSPVAVWKKLDRAKEKLRDSLTRAGYASALPGLESFFASLKPVAAPKGLLTKSILTKAATAALVGGAAVTLKLIATLAILVLGAAGALGFAVIRQRDERRRELVEQEAARARVRPVAAAPKAAAPAPARAEAPAPQAAAAPEPEEIEIFKTGKEFQAAFRKAAEIKDDAARWKAYRRIGFLRTPEQFRRLENDIRARAGTSEYERDFIGGLMKEWMATDFKGLLDFMMRFPSDKPMTRREKLEQTLLGAVQMNREATLAYAKALSEEDGRSEILNKLAPPEVPKADAVLGMPPGAERTQALQQLIRDWVSRDPRAAARWIDQALVAAEREQARSHFVAAWGLSDLRAAAAWVNETAAEKDRVGLLREIVGNTLHRDPKGAFDLAVESFTAKEPWCLEMENAFRLWSEADPQAAGFFLQSHPADNPQPTGREMRFEWISRTAKLWALRDPSAALEWAEKLQGADRTAALTALPGALVKSIISNPKEALSVIDKLPVAQRAEALSQLMEAWAEVDPRAAADFARSRPDAAALDEAIARQWAKRDFAASFAWAKALPAAGADRDTALGAIAVQVAFQDSADRGLQVAREIHDAQSRDPALEFISQQMSGKQLEQAIALTAEIVSPDRRRMAQDKILNSCSGQNPEVCLALLNRIPDAGQGEYIAFAQSWASKDPPAANAWADGLTRPELRESTLNYTFPAWARQDRGAALAWVTRAALSEKTRQKLLKLLPRD
ncbi:MAG TPA: sigma-70 family RNA polymerase sigma factor [Planctomycetota bacterium]|nr:sigma-70 family RNA polymerase sigma factor [Planctomycetota bacterium]